MEASTVAAFPGASMEEAFTEALAFVEEVVGKWVILYRYKDRFIGELIRDG